MKIVATAGQRRDTGTKSAELVAAVASQFDKTYHQCRETPSLAADSNLYIQYGFKRNGGLDAAMERNIPFIILDRGYFDDRQDKFSISINGFHGLSMKVRGVNTLRSRPKPPLQAMQKPGEFVYIYGQMPGDRAARGLTVETWLRKEAQKAAQELNMPVKIRPHPNTVCSWEPQLPPLDKTFADTFCSVSYTTTAATQATIAGIRHIALHPASPAWDVSAHSYAELDIPRILTREKWLHDLSYRNYGHDELKEAADYVRFAYEQAAKAAMINDYDTLELRP